MGCVDRLRGRLAAVARGEVGRRGRPRRVRASVHPDRRGHLVRGPGGRRRGVALDRQRIAAAERHGHELRRPGDVRHVVLGARLLEPQARLGKRHVAPVDHDDVAILVEHHGALADRGQLVRAELRERADRGLAAARVDADELVVGGASREHRAADRSRRPARRRRARRRGRCRPRRTRGLRRRARSRAGPSARGPRARRRRRRCASRAARRCAG